MATLWNRIAGRYYRTAAAKFARRPLGMKNTRPLISFTFDDFPISAAQTAGPILQRYGVAATYYTSFGLMGSTAPTGEIFHLGDLPALLAAGHELGCHTYPHCHATQTPASVFEQSIVDNRAALLKHAPSQTFDTLSYPIGCPRVATKRRVARHFRAARGGGQTYNRGMVDLNYLSAYFLEQNRDDPAGVKAVIDECCRNLGWLIFATHDVTENPTRYGCRPEFFEEIVRYAVGSGAAVLPVSAALNEIGG